MKKKNTARLFVLLARGWLRMSKPTDWLTSLAAIGTCLAAFTGAYMVASSGLLDTRRIELETKIQALKLQTLENQLAAESKRLADEAKRFADDSKRSRLLADDQKTLNDLRQKELADEAKRFADESKGLRGDAQYNAQRADLLQQLNANYERTIALYARQPNVQFVGTPPPDPVQIKFSGTIASEDLDKELTMPVTITRLKK